MNLELDCKLMKDLLRELSFLITRELANIKAAYYIRKKQNISTLGRVFRDTGFI